MHPRLQGRRRMRERGGQEFFGIGVLRRIEYLMAGAAFHHFAVLDHDHVVGQGADHRQVVALSLIHI